MFTKFYEVSTIRELRRQLATTVAFALVNLAFLYLYKHGIQQDFAFAGILISYPVAAFWAMRVVLVFMALYHIRAQDFKRRQENARKHIATSAKAYGSKLSAQKYPYDQEQIFYREVVDALGAGIKPEEVVAIARKSMGKIKRYRLGLDYKEQGLNHLSILPTNVPVAEGYVSFLNEEPGEPFEGKTIGNAFRTIWKNISADLDC